MSDVFDASKIKESGHPSDFIPAGAVTILGVDVSKDGDYTVKGFHDPATGEYHVQEVVHNDQDKARP